MRANLAVTPRLRGSRPSYRPCRPPSVYALRAACRRLRSDTRLRAQPLGERLFTLVVPSHAAAAGGTAAGTEPAARGARAAGGTTAAYTAAAAETAARVGPAPEGRLPGLGPPPGRGPPGPGPPNPPPRGGGGGGGRRGRREARPTPYQNAALPPGPGPYPGPRGGRGRRGRSSTETIHRIRITAKITRIILIMFGPVRYVVLPVSLLSVTP